MESINWIFGDEEVDIFVAFRFNQKVSPKGHKVRWTYTQQVKRNWNPDPNMIKNSPVPKKQLTNKAYDLEFAFMQNAGKLHNEHVH